MEKNHITLYNRFLQRRIVYKQRDIAKIGKWCNAQFERIYGELPGMIEQTEEVPGHGEKTFFVCNYPASFIEKMDQIIDFYFDNL